MAKTIIKATLKEATTDDTGKSVVVVEFDDNKGKWTKRYTTSQTQLTEVRLKELIKADLQRDLKVKDQLAEIKPLINKTFNVEL